MELYQEILCHVLANEKVQVSFPNFINTDVTKIVELECYKALGRIKTILENDALTDSECFQQIEEIVCTFDELGSNGGSRHDYGRLHRHITAR